MTLRLSKAAAARLARSATANTPGKAVARHGSTRETRGALSDTKTTVNAAEARTTRLEGSDLERTFDTCLARLAPHLPAPVAEYRFAAPRRFAFDRAWVAQRVAVELEGGVWSGGRHTRPAGYERDCEKYNIAVVEGWRVLRFTAKALESDPAACIGLLCEVLS